MQFDLARKLEIKQQIASLILVSYDDVFWKCITKLLQRKGGGEGEESGDKIHKYYRCERNTEETWKRIEVRSVIQQKKTLFFQFLANITLVTDKVKDKVHPRSGHEDWRGAEV